MKRILAQREFTRNVLNLAECRDVLTHDISWRIPSYKLSST
jgi:hypothetical protein